MSIPRSICPEISKTSHIPWNKADIGFILRKLCEQKGVKIIEANLKYKYGNRFPVLDTSEHLTSSFFRIYVSSDNRFALLRRSVERLLQSFYLGYKVFQLLAALQWFVPLCNLPFPSQYFFTVFREICSLAAICLWLSPKSLNRRILCKSPLLLPPCPPPTIALTLL